MKVVVMQGVSGSGKSTLSNKLFPYAKHFSADHYFMIGDEYKFDSSKLGDAHAECLLKFTNALMNGGNEDVLVVDNTNTSLWEMAPYIQLAAAMGAEVEVIRCICRTDVAADRNTHGVSLKACAAMQGRMEKPLSFWKCSYREVFTG